MNVVVSAQWSTQLILICKHMRSPMGQRSTWIGSYVWVDPGAPETMHHPKFSIDSIRIKSFLYKQNEHGRAGGSTQYCPCLITPPVQGHNNVAGHPGQQLHTEAVVTCGSHCCRHNPATVAAAVLFPLPTTPSWSLGLLSPSPCPDSSGYCGKATHPASVTQNSSPCYSGTS